MDKSLDRPPAHADHDTPTSECGCIHAACCLDCPLIRCVFEVKTGKYPDAKQLHKEGMSITKIADLYGVSKSAIRSALQ